MNSHEFNIFNNPIEFVERKNKLSFGLRSNSTLEIDFVAFFYGGLISSFIVASNLDEIFLVRIIDFFLDRMQ